ncbi:HET-domain-containing protein, partial [Hyaloscypha bicolor E]
MRLLNVDKFLNGEALPFEVFWGGNQPDYAILSHTWLEKEAEELRYQDIENRTRKGTKGYRKIRDCCRKAKQHGHGYVWADTCCIDKGNNVELSEAISSMFSWYKGAKICYAYLADYDVVKKFKESKWFKRGWTLQELIAPKALVFYSHDWKYILSKSDRDMCGLISEITGISTEVLAGEQDALKNSSVAQRMPWASGRKTTRPEDIAYCLLGIFGVRMSLFYSEGGKEAFIRLQKTIMKQSDDHSLFAWSQ